jgi:hypothetical protein
MVAAGALCPQPAGGIRAYPGYDTASYKEREERSPPGEPGSDEDGAPDGGRGQGAEPGQGGKPKAIKAMAALTRKLAGTESEPRGDVKGLIG